MILIPILLAVVGGSIFLYDRMAKGPNAIHKMSAAERDFLETKLTKIPFGATYQEVEEVLGVPIRGLETQRPTWLGPDNNNLSQIAVYLTKDNTVRKIKWMKLGVFVWERIWE